MGVGEWPSGGLGALSMGNWEHISAQRYTRSSCAGGRGGGGEIVGGVEGGECAGEKWSVSFPWTSVVWV